MPLLRPGAIAVSLALACAAVAGGRSVSASPQAPQTTTQPKPTGLIVGKVVDGLRNTPVTSAIVTLTGGGLRRAERVIVDSQGRFVFTGLPAGAFTINVAKTGFLDSSYGVLRPDGAGRPLELQAGERVTDAVIRLWRFAAISGAVVDDASNPVPGTVVRALRRTIVGGRWRFSAPEFAGRTDDRGIYRIAGLPPGDYGLYIASFNSSLPLSLLSEAAASRSASTADAARTYSTNGVIGYISDLQQGATVSRFGDVLVQMANNNPAPPAVDSRILNVYPTVWHPAAATPAEASIVSVGAGDNRTGIDLRPTLTRAVRMSGTVTGPNGPVPHLALRLAPERLDDVAAIVTASLSGSLNTSIAVSDSTGAFTFLVPPGQYVIRVMTTPPAPAEPPPPPGTPPGPPMIPMVSTDPTLWALQRVSVGDSDMTGVGVVLRRGIRLTGRVEFEGSAAKPAGTELRGLLVRMDPADGHLSDSAATYRGQIDPTGRFYTIGLAPGRYVLRMDGVPRGWILKSAMLNGKDIVDTPVTLADADIDGVILTFTDRPTTLSGTVRDDKGQPDIAATVLVFPADGAWTNRGLIPRTMRSLRASRTGTFSFYGLPAGEYCVIAVSDAIAGNWQEPAFLQKLSRAAARMNITDGQAATLSLVTATGVQR